MADKVFPDSQLPIRRTVELLPSIFQTPANDKFLSAVLDPLVQPGVLQKTVGYVGRRYGKTYNGTDIYLDNDNTLRSRYQLEPAVVNKVHGSVNNFYDYLDLKNQLKFFGNEDDRDDKITSQEHYSWDPPIDWDKFVNYREYFWEPLGPPPIPVKGQSPDIISSYKVVLGLGSSFVFTPDGRTNNPTINLYRGQTYKFKVNAPAEGFFIRRNYDSNSLAFVPDRPYRIGQLVVYDGKLWKAKVDVSASDGSSITLESQDWEYQSDLSSGTSLDYNDGVTNNGTENGEIIFEVPYDAPDILFYQGRVDSNKLGQFVVSDIESNSFIDVEKEILGKSDYLSSNNVQFTNGLVVEFVGNVKPAKYSKDTWLIEGVGKSITLTKFNDLTTPVIVIDTPEILFDNEGFDSLPFDDATSYPAEKDYVTISKSSLDRNPWSRYNRWFHRSVLEYAYSFRKRDFSATESLRAKRPIIEFLPNIQLFNHGAIAKESVDFVDLFTEDVFSTIEGSSGYIIEGEDLFEGARILVAGDKDFLANNKIYSVRFIVHNGRRQITLKETVDSQSQIGDCVLVKRGKFPSLGGNKGLMFHYNGTEWVKSQQKNAINQSPLYDAFDEDEISFSDTERYPVSTFRGNKIVSYKTGNSVLDPELGFSLSYLNIDNVGDILFNWEWENTEFSYTIERQVYTKKIYTGFYRENLTNEYKNGWIRTAAQFSQPIIDSVKIEESTNSFEINTVDWNKIVDDNSYIINFYLNGTQIKTPYTRNKNTFTFEQVQFVKNDVVAVKIICDLAPLEGYYEIPLGLEKNPLNLELSSFTLGQAVDHLSTALEFNRQFIGKPLGASNLRDLSDYQQHAKRFLKHGGSLPIGTMLLCDKTANIIKSIQYAKKSYTEYKNNFLKKAIEIEYNSNIIDFVDDIISALTRTKNEKSPFSDTDTLGNGAFTSIEYVVEDTGINTFALSQKFSLEEFSRRAVYVYLNNEQLLNTVDYVFDSTFGFVRVLTTLNENDVIQIREYISTASNHIPPTPTVLGMYKKYTPMMYRDDTYIEPRTVIQGHDGSIMSAFGDYRDELLLEFEKRIYNNIKVEYDPNYFDIDKVLGNYYYTGLYDKDQLDGIVNFEFLKWIQNTNINYTQNSYLDEFNSFTYTYSNMTDPTGRINLPGYWRGVYYWFYDTVRPHTCPWEMLGFSEKPSWWEEEYGPAPYTSGNLVLWEDLAEGLIKQGPRAGIHERYKRSTLLNHIPVDGDGKLLSPLDSGLANDFSLINNKGPFVLGDIGPVEYAWRSSSEWPFAIAIAMCLMKPFDFINSHFDRIKVKKNKINQTVSKNSGFFLQINDFSVSSTGTDISSGLIQYVMSYLKSRGYEPIEINQRVQNLTVALSSRMSGFVDKTQQKYLLDSKNPKSTSSGVYIPAENYDIIFNVSSPISSVSYSGVIVEKTEGGWTITGYDTEEPYFRYNEAYPGQKDPLIQVGGVSELFVDWEPGKTISNGQIIRYRVDFYRALKTHKISEDGNFDSTLYKKIAKLPQVGAVEAFKRKTFNNLAIKKLSYGTKLTSIQQVVDFLLGYENYLTSIGFKFENYDPENQVSQDWTTASKEFMFWTKHNWAVGSLITLSPGAQKIAISIPVGVADNFLEGFYDYQILKADGKPLFPQYINVRRDFQNVEVETTNTTDGIHYLRAYYVLKEHVTVFDDRTVFNDIIYDQTTGYRQERIRSQGFRTVDWDGDYTSPGFIFDNVRIDPWQPFVDYKLGDIVSYKSYNWTSQVNQLGSEEFDDTKWTRLDTTPEKQLVANFDYRINQFEDFYEAASEGAGDSQRMLARHTVGYQTRTYLQNIIEDPVTQFQIYQGFVREKGTQNSISKVFDKLSKTEESSIVLNEEWALKVGKFGGTNQLTETEFQLKKNNFIINPQPLLIQSNILDENLDDYYRIGKSDFTVASDPFDVNINRISFDAEPLRTAGYLIPEYVDFILANRDDILNLDINSVKENNHIWITFDGISWNVLRLNESPLLVIRSAIKTGASVELTLNRFHYVNVGDIIGIRNVVNLTGFFKVTAVELTKITIAVSADAKDPGIDDSTAYSLHLFTEARYDSYQHLDFEEAALLKQGAKLFVDRGENDRWEILEKNKQFISKTLTNFGVQDPLRTGEKVLYDDTLKQMFVALPGTGYVIVYVETSTGLALKQIIEPPFGFESKVKGSFGQGMALSPDNRFLIIGAPKASAIESNYMGRYDHTVEYQGGQIVLYAGNLWKAKVTIGPDSTLSDVYNEFWEPVTSVPATPVGDAAGAFEQGIVSVYEYSNQRWDYKESLVSPRVAASEYFGTNINVGYDGTNYYMAVAAPGALNDKGRVYLYKYVPNDSIFKTVDGTTAVDLITNIITFNEPHNYFNGQRLRYFNGTIEGRDKSLADSPSAPLDNTLIFVMVVNQYEIQIAQSIEDVKTSNEISLKEFGIDDSSSHTFISDVRASGWQHIENQRYRGIYESSASYVAGDIVWWDNRLFEAKGTIIGDQSTIHLADTESGSVDWMRLDPISIHCSLPQIASFDIDSAYLSIGLVGEDQLIELIKEEDRFGSSMAMSRDGSILVVGAPNSDNQYFPNFRGIWNPYQEYQTNDVVKYGTGYYKLVDNRENATDIFVSKNEDPSDSENWLDIGDSTSTASGKVFIYQRNNFGRYTLVQTINADSLPAISDIPPSEVIASGDQFGWAVDIDYSGTTIVVTSPQADINFQNQGSAYIFYKEDSANLSYRLKQKIESFESYPNEYFGQSISISPNTERIVVGAKNTPSKLTTRFDGFSTTFDQNKTRFVDIKGFGGAVYSFERKTDRYYLTEKLEADLSPDESFGYSIDVTDSIILVGSPDYVAPVLNENTLTFEGSRTGTIRFFKKDQRVNSLNTLSKQQPVVDINKIKSISLYDNVKNVKIQDVDFIDPAKLKVLNQAEQEINFKTLYDPAIYTIGKDDTSVDPSLAWAEKHVGEIWWNLSSSKWNYYEQGDLASKIGNWGVQALGSEIVICEWVESLLLPSEWAALADTNEGLAEGISGQPLHPNDDVYTIKQIFNITTGQPTATKYFYWVKNKVTVPANSFRRISASQISNLISNPQGYGGAFLAIIDSDKFLAYNFPTVLTSNTAWLNIQYRKDNGKLNSIHNEYQLITENVADSIPTEKLERKWLDSLAGYDSIGNRVPDPGLPDKIKYGIEFRPRQSMFVDRVSALKVVVDKVNSILSKDPFADIIDFRNLNLVDEIPTEKLNLYDLIVDSYIDLSTIGTFRIIPAKVKANVVNGEIDSIDILNPGLGYKVPPPIVIDGDGIGAKFIAVLNNQGSISRIDIIDKGKKYNFANVSIRNFSVLVRVDVTSDNSWSIYAWDEVRSVFFRTQTQAFDTTKYWDLIDWWREGYSITSRIIKEISDIFQEVYIDTEIGDLIRIKEYGSGGWAVFEKISNTGQEFLDRYKIVAREKGTISINSRLYSDSAGGAGFGGISFDTDLYDVDNSIELRNIFSAIKNDIFVGDYNDEWNKLFFTSLRYIFSEQYYIDWAFKTSFVNIIHNVGSLEKKPNYRNDNLESFQEYINEVKPYRTTVREYVSRYNTIEDTRSVVTDFDLPPIYSIRDGAVIPVDSSGVATLGYPWKWWNDNKGFSVIEIQVSNAGSGYVAPPTVVIEGTGTGATAKAYISNGRVSGIEVLTAGENYLEAPKVTLVGGTGPAGRSGSAVSIIGNTKPRTFNLSIKFDRITKTGIYENFVQTQTFTATGFSSIFDLNYAPTRDKNKIKVFKNKQLVLDNEYKISLFKTSIDNFTILKGKLELLTVPAKDDVIEIIYEKNDAILDAVNRIEKFYSPAEGMKGKDVGQLMTGIDFGGVQIQGTTFEITGGWDALPWFSDNWDSVESSRDFYYVVNSKLWSGQTTSFVYNGSNNTIDIIGNANYILLKNSSTIPLKINVDYTVNTVTEVIILKSERFISGDVITIRKEYIAGTVVSYGDKIYEAVSDNINQVPGTSESWEILKIRLPFVPDVFQQINIYLKRAAEQKSVRIDDPNYSAVWDSSSVVNPNAQMPTFIGDGSTNVVDIQNYLDLSEGDTLIFRTLESDGSVTINDENILDTQISGGNLSQINTAYVTATGVLPEEIIIEGGKFVSPDQVPAPEENVPGQVLDSVSIKVFNSISHGTAPLGYKTLVADGSTRIFDIGMNVLESESVRVYINKSLKVLGNNSDNYSIDFRNNRIEFVTTPNDNDIIEIISIGAGGYNLLDYQEYLGDGITSIFKTNANYDRTDRVFVTVNGEYQEIGFINSSDVDSMLAGKAVVQFGFVPTVGTVIKVVCLGSNTESTTGISDIVRIYSQEFEYEGSTRSYEINGFIESPGSILASSTVEINGRLLTGIDTNYYTIDATYLRTINIFEESGALRSSRQVYEVEIGKDPFETSGTILSSNLKVFVNDDLKTFIRDYVYDGTTKIITFELNQISEGDIVKIENDFRSQYQITNGSLIIDSEVDIPIDSIIKLTWFNEYRSMKIVSDEYTGGKVQYNLSFRPISVNYLFVYKNGQRLSQDVDYFINDNQKSIRLSIPSSATDLIKIILFGTDVYKLPSAYEIHKDMLNIYHYKRYSTGTSILSKDLNYYDNEIYVTEGNLLDEPIPTKNIPGILLIEGEKIEYLRKDGNVLSNLRRGTFGTAIREIYPAGTRIANMGPSETIPYIESQENNDFVVGTGIDFVYDGSTKTFSFATVESFGFGIKNNLIVTVKNTILNTSSKTTDYTLETITNESGAVIDRKLTMGDSVVLEEGFIINVSTVLIGPLNYTPVKSDKSTYRISETQITVVDEITTSTVVYDSVPQSYGVCDQIEVFVQGRRLRKDSIDLYQENLGANSPEADITQEAEFTVDGESSYIRLTTPVKAGTKVSVVRKLGKIWYERGDAAASKGLTLLENNTPQARFIAQKTTRIPE